MCPPLLCLHVPRCGDPRAAFPYGSPPGSGTALTSFLSFHGGASGPLFTGFPQIKKGRNLGISNSVRLSPQRPLPELAVTNSPPLFSEAMSKQPGPKGYVEIQIRTGLTAFKSKNEVGVETIYRRTSLREGEQTEPAVAGQGHKAPTSFTD